MWDENKHPRDAKGRFCFAYGSWRTRSEMEEIRRLEQKYTSQSLLPSTIPLPDEQLPRSVGAKWANYEITMPDGSKAKFVDGAILEQKEIIAGYRVRRKIDTIQDLLKRFPETKSTPRYWTKVKGISEIVLSNGEHVRAELHWYEHPKTGKQDFKYKDDADYEG